MQTENYLIISDMQSDRMQVLPNIKDTAGSDYPIRYPFISRNKYRKQCKKWFG